VWCPKCANFKTEVIGTKLKKENVTARFRFCPICEFSFLTIEFINNSENRDKYKKSLEKLN
jgi:transcriptional regulator NrdR family protein